MRTRGAVITVLAIILVGALATSSCRQSGDPEVSGDGLHQAVPSMVGMTLEDAEARIGEAGYELGEVTEESREGQEPGEVVAQEPVAGTSLPRGGEIGLTVAK